MDVALTRTRKNLYSQHQIDNWLACQIRYRRTPDVLYALLRHSEGGCEAVAFRSKGRRPAALVLGDINLGCTCDGWSPWTVERRFGGSGLLCLSAYGRAWRMLISRAILFERRRRRQ
jgi:hypothetical protein